MNTLGDYECLCHSNYKLHWNKKDCVGKVPSKYISTPDVSDGLVIIVKSENIDLSSKVLWVIVPGILLYFFIEAWWYWCWNWSKQAKNPTPKTGDTLRDFDAFFPVLLSSSFFCFLLFLCMRSFADDSFTWKEIKWCDLPVILFCFDFLSKQHINCMGALRYQLTKAAACWFISRVYVDLLLLWVFVLSYLETKGPLPDNMSPKVLLHCIKSGGSDRCFLSCSSDVQVFFGKSKPTKTSMWFCGECKSSKPSNSHGSPKK